MFLKVWDHSGALFFGIFSDLKSVGQTNAKEILQLR